MKKTYALLLLVSLSALSGCIHHHHGRGERGDWDVRSSQHQQAQQDHRGHYDDRGGARR